MPRTESKQTKPPGKTSMFVESVPVDLKRRFKAACAARGVTMAAAIKDFMRRMVSEGIR